MTITNKIPLERSLIFSFGEGSGVKEPSPNPTVMPINTKNTALYCGSASIKANIEETTPRLAVTPTNTFFKK